MSINQINHEESENCGPETLGSLLRAQGTLKKFKISMLLFRDFLKGLTKND